MGVHADVGATGEMLQQRSIPTDDPMVVVADAVLAEEPPRRGLHQRAAGLEDEITLEGVEGRRLVGGKERTHDTEHRAVAVLGRTTRRRGEPSKRAGDFAPDVTAIVVPR